MKLLWSVFAAVGGVLVTIGLVLFTLDLRFFAGAERTGGEVIDVRFGNRGAGAPDIAWTDDAGRSHVYRSNTSSRPPYRVGDRVTIAYHPDDPDNPAIDAPFDRWFFPGLFTGMGSVQLGLGLFGLLRRARRKREIAWLTRAGQRLDATITAVTQDTSIHVNRKHPWVIHCQATLPGESEPRTFVSRRFWYEPRPYLRRPTLTVYYDPQAPARHVVDTGDLHPRRPPPAPQS